MPSECPGSRVPLLKGPAECSFHQPLRGGNKLQGELSAVQGPHLQRPGQVLGGLEARFQRHLDIISSSTVWPVGWGGAGGRGQELAGGEREESHTDSWGQTQLLGGRGRRVAVRSSLQTPAPCSALIRRPHQRELRVNDDICLTEEMEREGLVGREGPAAPLLPWAALEDSSREGGGWAKLAFWST